MDNRSFTFCTLIIMKILLWSQRIFGTIEKCGGHVKETKIIILFLDFHQRIWLLFVQIVLSNMQINKVGTCSRYFWVFFYFECVINKLCQLHSGLSESFVVHG